MDLNQDWMPRDTVAALVEAHLSAGGWLLRCEPDAVDRLIPALQDLPAWCAWLDPAPHLQIEMLVTGEWELLSGGWLLMRRRGFWPELLVTVDASTPPGLLAHVIGHPVPTHSRVLRLVEPAR